MKQDVMIELIRKVKSQPSLMRKVKIFVAVGVVGFVITGALLVWAGLSAVKFVALQTSELTQSSFAKEQVEKVKNELNGLPRLKPLTCWGQAQSLMAVQPWVERPANDNLMNLKVACLEQAPVTCEGTDCAKIKELIKTAEGKTI
jgi:hypothetical protein